MNRAHPLARLGGVRPELGSESSRDRALYGGLGSLLLVTGTVGGVGMWILAQMLFGLSWAFALIPAALWAVCVIAIDRALTTTFPDTLSPRIALPIAGRLAIALVIGVIVSTPITLQLFKGEIDVKIATLQADLREELNARNSADPLVAQIPALTQSIADAEATVAAGPTAARAAPTYLAAAAAESAAQADWTAKVEALNAEAQGTAGTLERGDGPVAGVLKTGVDAAYGIYLQRQAATQAALTDAMSAATAAVAAANTTLTDDGALLTQAREREKELTAANEDRIAAAGGLHNRLNALFQIGGESASGFAIHLAWFLFFLSIEMLPVLYKLTMVGRKPTEAAEALSLLDKSVVVDAREALKRRTAAAEAETATAVAQTDARRDVGVDSADRERSRGLWWNENFDQALRERAPQVIAADVDAYEFAAPPRHAHRFATTVVGNPTDESAPPDVHNDDVDDQAWDVEQPRQGDAADQQADDATQKHPIVGGRFRLVDRYQSGSTEVWKAVDLFDEMRAIVAVKLLPGIAPDDDDADRRSDLVAREITMVQRLPDHDNVMKVLTAGVTDDTHQWWYASPWYGPSLHAYLASMYLDKRRDAMPQLITVVEYVRDAALGLAAAHARGISHGDIKPGNLVLDEVTRRVRVIDFGLARTIDTLSRARSHMPKGTIYYSAPELSVRGDGGQSPFLADVFSLGGVLYFLLTGRRPRFSKDVPVDASVEEVVLDILDGRLTLAPISSTLPTELVSLAVRALAPDPDQRFGYWAPDLAAQEFADALDEMMQRWGRETRQLRVGPQLLTTDADGWEASFYRSERFEDDGTESSGRVAPRLETSRPLVETRAQPASDQDADFDPFDELVFPITTHIRSEDLEVPTEQMGEDAPDGSSRVDEVPTQPMPPRIVT